MHDPRLRDAHRKPEEVRIPPPDGPWLVLTTIGDADVAGQIARTLLDERLIACANLLPAGRSIYRWQGAIEEAEETLLLLKTTRNRYRSLEARLRELHPYELPEIVAIRPEAVLPAYASWIIGETRRPLARLPVARAATTEEGGFMDEGASPEEAEQDRGNRQHGHDRPPES